MWIDKAKTWEMALDLGGNKLINIIKNYTHTCYIGDRSQLNDWGFGCGQCPACELRKKGYIKWQEGLSISS